MNLNNMQKEKKINWYRVQIEYWTDKPNETWGNAFKEICNPNIKHKISQLFVLIDSKRDLVKTKKSKWWFWNF